MKVIIDTSVLIHFHRTHTEEYPRLLQFAKKDEIDLLISSLTIFEYWSGKDLERKNKLLEAEKLFEPLVIIKLDKQIAQKAGEMSRILTSPIQPIDVLIAATAFIHHAEIATYNTKHFKKIPEVKLFDWKRIKK